MAVSVAKISQASQNSIGSSKVALQAQQYAASKAELVKAEKYSDLTAQTKSIISNSNTFYDEVIIGDETDYPDNDKIKQRDVTINVYSSSEILPRASLKFTRYSVSTDSTSLPQGSIIPWYGNKADIPEGFALCDGQNGTPDLRDRFLVGAGSTYSLGAKGGEATHKLVGAELPSQSANVSGLILVGSRGFTYSSDGGSDLRASWGKTSGYYAYRELSRVYNNNGGGFVKPGIYSGSFYGVNMLFYDKVDSVLSIGKDQPHENRPPYYALYYIMKV